MYANLQSKEEIRQKIAAKHRIATIVGDNLEDFVEATPSMRRTKPHWRPCAENAGSSSPAPRITPGPMRLVWTPIRK
jgi:hypothetical protein